MSGRDVRRGHRGQAEGPFKTSEGLLERFGPERVRDTPISEMGFVGVARRCGGDWAFAPSSRSCSSSSSGWPSTSS